MTKEEKRKLLLSIKPRFEAINSAESDEELKTTLCSFFEDGGCEECILCLKRSEDLAFCKNDYLSKIRVNPMLTWDESFDKMVAPTISDKEPRESIESLGVSCDRCYLASKCPKYAKRSTCSIDFKSGVPNSATEMIETLIGIQYERVQRASVIEKLDGGVPDENLSREMDRLNRLIYDKANLGRERVSISLEATGSAPTTSATASAGGGILSRIFGAPTKAVEEPKGEIIEIEAEKELAK